MNGGGDWNWKVLRRSFIRARSRRAFVVVGRAGLGVDDFFRPPPRFVFFGRPRDLTGAVGPVVTASGHGAGVGSEDRRFPRTIFQA